LYFTLIKINCNLPYETTYNLYGVWPIRHGGAEFVEAKAEASMGLFNLFHVKESASATSVLELRPRGDSYVRIDGTDHGIRAWNPAGFHIAPYSGALAVGQIARVRFVLRDFHDAEGDLRIDDQIRVESIDETGLRARWWHLPARKKTAISDCFTAKVAASV
jgi:hypothetical protein